MTDAALSKGRTGSGLFFASLVTGMGLGGFVDGILLHQILQWHHMVCPTPDCRPASVESLMQLSLLDGLFHVLAWGLTLAGIIALFRLKNGRQQKWSGPVFAGGLLAGWGIFNLVEGFIDHYLLQIHHVRPGPNQAIWDLAFLLLGGMLLMVGWLLARSRSILPDK